MKTRYKILAIVILLLVFTILIYYTCFKSTSTINLTRENKNQSNTTIIDETYPTKDANMNNGYTDISSYMGQNLTNSLSNFNNMTKVNTTDNSNEYKNEDIVLSSSGENIDFININNKCNYSIMGIYIGMEKSQAFTILDNDGWSVMEERETIKRYIKDNYLIQICSLRDSTAVNAVIYSLLHNTTASNPTPSNNSGPSTSQEDVSQSMYISIEELNTLFEEDYNSFKNNYDGKTFFIYMNILPSEDDLNTKFYTIDNFYIYDELDTSKYLNQRITVKATINVESEYNCKLSNIQVINE